MRWRRHHLLLLVCVVALGLRLLQLVQEPVWYDEIWSLCVSTGHFVPMEPSSVSHLSTAADFRKLAEFQPGPLDLKAVLRANGSQMHPPLYAVLLSLWMYVLGVSDLSLRSFSLVWGIACLPLVYLIARRCGGRQASLLATAFAAVHPLLIHYSVEGRDYIMMLFFGLLMLWCALRCYDKGINPLRFAGLTTCAVAGTLSHYFFVPAAAGCYLWLLLTPGKCQRKLIALSATAAALLMVPWFIFMPHAVSSAEASIWWFIKPTPIIALIACPLRVLLWELMDEPAAPFLFLITVPLAVAWAAVMVRNSPLNSQKYIRLVSLLLFVPLLLSAPLIVSGLAAVVGVFVYASAYLATTWRLPPHISMPRRRAVLSLLYISILAPLAGPIGNYLIIGGRLIACSRFYLNLLVPSLILLALGCLSLPRRLRPVIAGSLIALWTAGTVAESLSGERMAENIPAIASFVSQQPQHYPVLFDALPALVVGIARRTPGDREFLCWYDASENQHTGRELAELLNGRFGIVLVHSRQRDWKTYGFEPPLQRWLMHHARLAADFQGTSRVLVFVPQNGSTFDFVNIERNADRRANQAGALTAP